MIDPDDLEDNALIKLGKYSMMLAVVLWPINVILVPFHRVFLWVQGHEFEVGFWDHLFQVSWRKPLAGLLFGLAFAIAGLIYQIAFVVPEWINSRRLAGKKPGEHVESILLIEYDVRVLGTYAGAAISYFSGAALIFSKSYQWLVILIASVLFSISIYVIIVFSSRKLGLGAFMRAKRLLTPYLITNIVVSFVLMLIGSLAFYQSVRLFGGFNLQLHGVNANDEGYALVNSMMKFGNYWPAPLQTLRSILYSIAICIGLAWIMPHLIHRNWKSLAVLVITLMPVLLAFLPKAPTDIMDNALRGVSAWFLELPLPVSMAVSGWMGALFLDFIKSRFESNISCPTCSEPLEPDYRHCPGCGKVVG